MHHKTLETVVNYQLQVYQFPLFMIKEKSLLISSFFQTPMSFHNYQQRTVSSSLNHFKSLDN